MDDFEANVKIQTNRLHEIDEMKDFFISHL